MATKGFCFAWSLGRSAPGRGNILALVSLPVVGLLYVLNFARVFWADLGYGIAVGILAPLAIFKALV